MNEPIPRPIPFERLEELRGSKRPTFRSLDEVQWLYFPKRTEQLFLRWGDPKEVKLCTS